MLNLKLRDKTKPFKESMDNGTIYFEYSNGFTIAMHRSLYTCEGVDTTKNLVYKKFIDTLNNDNKNIKLIKLYYKVENIDDAGNDSQNIWVDLKLVSSNTAGNIYRYAYDYHNNENLQISVKNIKLTRYIDKNYNVFVINFYDGTIYNDEVVCNNIKIHTRDKRYIDILRYSINNPLSIKEYLKDDIKIELKDVDIINYSQSLKNTLFWLNGRFVEPSIDENNEKIAYLVKGMGSVDYKHIGFIGSDPLTPYHGEDYPVASYEPEYSRYKYGPNFDINLFKWENVLISNWIKPFTFNNKKYYYSDNLGFNLTIKYPSEIIFPSVIPNEHLLIHNGIIMDRNEYTVYDSTIRLNNIREKVEIITNSSIEEYGKINSIKYIVKKNLPKAGDFRLIIFTHEDETKNLILNRSKSNYKNYPFPFHITFPKLNVGDLVLLDGIYERYLLHDQNMIRYPYTTYLARYESRNLLDDTSVERIWFSEEIKN